jgi:catechol 2,3-dioxygenase-like lactoylglutathione lyase family enzyme
MPGIATFSITALDCPDPLALARFYSELTGLAIDGDSDGEWVQLVRANDGPTLAFQRAADHQPPQWPSSDHPQQLHLDFEVPDLDAAEQAVLAIGARKADHQPGESWRVFLDPAGHPFCLCKS